ncbi:MAG: hypothetical protein R2724_03695 [Bryobacterales bacterium]
MRPGESTEPPETQAEQALQKVIGIVQALGLPPENIVYTQVYMENLADLPAVDEHSRKPSRRIRPPALFSASPDCRTVRLPSAPSRLPTARASRLFRFRATPRAAIPLGC